MRSSTSATDSAIGKDAACNTLGLTAPGNHNSCPVIIISLWYKVAQNFEFDLI